MAGKKRDDNAALGRIKDLAQRVLDLPLGERTPLAHDVGGVRKQQARAFRTGELPEKTQVRARAAQGVGVELEVAAVHHPAHGGFHAQAETFGDGVTDRKEMKGQVAQG